MAGFTVKSFDDLVSDMVSYIIAKAPQITDLSPGSVIRSFCEGAGLGLEEIYVAVYLGFRRELENTKSKFSFTFGQYIGETPEDENDSHRHAQDHIAERLPGELVLRKEMRKNPPHILLTNYSMLEYLLIRPDDSPLFDNGRALWWNFIILDEAHQYRGAKGIEMGMLIRRLKSRLKEGGRSKPIRPIPRG